MVSLLDKKEWNRHAKFSLKRNRMKSLLDLNISLENTLDILHMKWEFKASNFQLELLGFLDFVHRPVF
jgi:hypothetical protein